MRHKKRPGEAETSYFISRKNFKLVVFVYFKDRSTRADMNVMLSMEMIFNGGNYD